MTFSTGIALAMLIGIAGTTTIHLSKGMMKHGVVILRSEGGHSKSGKTIYAIGVAMNFTNPLWVILANRFAPTVYYTSMYGLGLVSLLLFSHFLLHESIGRRKLAGAAIVVTGTLLVGTARLLTPLPGMYLASRAVVFTIAALWVVASVTVGLFSRRSPVTLQELLFGLFGGGLAALEAVMKGIAQSGEQGGSFLPRDSAGWWIFGISFLGAAGAFGMIQWSYLRRCRVAVMAAAYDVAYVALPLIIVLVAIPGEVVSLAAAAGLALLATGAFIMQTEARKSLPKQS